MSVELLDILESVVYQKCWLRRSLRTQLAICSLSYATHYVTSRSVTSALVSLVQPLTKPKIHKPLACFLLILLGARRN